MKSTWISAILTITNNAKVRYDEVLSYDKEQFFSLTKLITHYGKNIVIYTTEWEAVLPIDSYLSDTTYSDSEKLKYVAKFLEDHKKDLILGFHESGYCDPLAKAVQNLCNQVKSRMFSPTGGILYRIEHIISQEINRIKTDLN